MRRSTPFVLAGAAAAGLLAAGFPARTGLTRSEAAVSLPGDLLVPTATIVADRAVRIGAGADAVWPWLTQIGQDRGGFYSWTPVENALGCEIEDARDLRPEWSEREVGDEVSLAPGMTLRVAVSSPGRALVLTSEGGRVPEESAGSASMRFAFTWAFVLIDEGGACVLHVRERYRPDNRSADLMIRAVLAASAVMTVRMLRTIRRLAEGR
ncbi:MAG: hypothetical protein LKI83_05420 [Actinomyces sp.]|jgi:hypothetical protein|nr:hypothetical protein [Actinomyces sp.]